MRTARNADETYKYALQWKPSKFGSSVHQISQFSRFKIFRFSLLFLLDALLRNCGAWMYKSRARPYNRKQKSIRCIDNSPFVYYVVTFSDCQLYLAQNEKLLYFTLSGLYDPTPRHVRNKILYDMLSRNLRDENTLDKANFLPVNLQYYLHYDSSPQARNKSKFA